MMTLQRGSEVEVFNSRVVPQGSWWRATVMSVHGETSRIKYRRAPPDMGNAIFERISVNFLRPCPPPFPFPLRLLPGHIVEVYDVGSWKPAKILEVVNRSNIHVELVGTLGRFTIHRCNVRVRCFLQDNKWIMHASDFMDSDYVNHGCPLPNELERNPREPSDNHSAGRLPETDEEPHRCVEFGEWRTGSADAEFAADHACSERSFNGSNNVDMVNITNGRSSPSAGGQNLEPPPPPPSGHGRSMQRSQMNAYRSIVAEIYDASGSITWEQETLMTKIRGILRISNDEHMWAIRYLANSS